MGFRKYFPMLRWNTSSIYDSLEKLVFRLTRPKNNSCLLTTYDWQVNLGKVSDISFNVKQSVVIRKVYSLVQSTRCIGEIYSLDESTWLNGAITAVSHKLLLLLCSVEWWWGSHYVLISGNTPQQNILNVTKTHSLPYDNETRLAPFSSQTYNLNHEWKEIP